MQQRPIQRYQPLLTPPLSHPLLHRSILFRREVWGVGHVRETHDEDYNDKKV